MTAPSRRKRSASMAILFRVHHTTRQGGGRTVSIRANSAEFVRDRSLTTMVDEASGRQRALPHWRGTRGRPEGPPSSCGHPTRSSRARRRSAQSPPAAEWLETGREDGGRAPRRRSGSLRARDPVPRAGLCAGLQPWLLLVAMARATLGADARTLFVSIGSDDW